MKRSFRNEARAFIAAQIGPMGWTSLIYPFGIYFVTDFSSRFPLMLYSVMIFQFIGVLGLAWASKKFRSIKEDSDLEIWEWKVIAFRTMVTLSMMTLVVANFTYNATLHWGSFFSAALWVVSTEVMIQAFHPLPIFALSQVVLVGVAPMVYLILQRNESSAVGYFGVLYLISAGVKLRNQHKLFVHNVFIKFKYLNEHNRYQDFIDIMPARVAWLDHSFNYIMVNNSMAEAFGMKKDAYIGQRMGFAKAEMAGEVKILMQDFIQGPETDLYFQAELPIHGKSARWHQMHIKKMHRNGELNYIFVLLDMDDSKRMEQQLEIEKARGIQSARLVSLGEMAAGIAHEIRNPLAIIHGNAEIVKLDLKKPQFDVTKTLNRIVKIEEMVERITKIIESMRKLSRDASHEDLAWEDHQAVLVDPVDLTAAKLKLASIDLSTQFLDKVEILCQAQQIGQVILNLINNSYDILKHQESDRKMKVVAQAADDGWLEIIVGDNGPGAKDPSKLFTPFYTTKDAGEGTGIGLSLSKKILEAHSGTLIYRRQGLWTEFVLRLPPGSVRAKNSINEDSAA